MHGDQRFRFVSPSIGFAEEDQEFDPHVHYFRTVEGGRTFHAFQPRIVRR
jgi:hypothetical protein